MVWNFLLVAVLSAVASTAVSAQSVQQTLSKFGLLGTWATDCNRPAAKDNFYTVYSASSGKVLRTYYDGPGKIYNEYAITQATQISNDEIRYQQEGTDSRRLRLEIILKKADNRILVWLSRHMDGGTVVKDGKYTDDGTAVVWQTKCQK